ncbi:RagB/SusD family nutrient uptake outer membrane protein [Flaviaesturariibacter amylovorans]|uniref:RagB/SusD family nutrient uptake outer membrane protein n=1 Tax=Flaviaesturariibacter amylovorans TaxID=1084520 RepID=A0ABP8HQ95_9BACT
MKQIKFYHLFLALATAVLVTSCAKKLDVRPENQFLAQDALKDATGYRAFLAKNYAGLATTGNVGPAGASDILGLDEGSQSPFIRGWFNVQELPTDEAIVSWDDQTIKDYHFLRWTPNDPFLYGLYSRLVYNVALANEYLRESTDDKLSARGITGTDADAIRASRAEVRWLRAFNYSCMIDVFGKSTFITENSRVNDLPQETTRQALFTYVESELKALETELPTAKTAEYGRVDRGAAWALLARLYLNAGVYTGTNRFTDAITYATKVINAGYTLRPNYPSLFMADNDKQKDEFIFAINCDGLRTQSYGNTTFLVHAPAGDNALTEYNINGGWYGYRTTQQLVNLFADPTGNTDKRALFYDLGAGTISDVGQYAQGIKVRKFRNVRTDGGPVSDPRKDFADIDFPVFRLAEMYLIYAEAVLRGGTGGDNATALQYVNKIRERAFGTTAQGQLASINLQTVLDERGRELYWEGHRRTDLVRYNQLTTSTYLWQWKGGSQAGTAVDAKFNLFPVPQQVRSANPNLTQNSGY